MRSQTKPAVLQGKRLRAVRADEIRPGDVLWSDATARELRVVAAHRERVRADGNLYAPEDEAGRGGELTEAIVLTVLDEATRGMQRLGAFAARARLQVVAPKRKLPELRA